MYQTFFEIPSKTSIINRAITLVLLIDEIEMNEAERKDIKNGNEQHLKLRNIQHFANQFVKILEKKKQHKQHYFLHFHRLHAFPPIPLNVLKTLCSFLHIFTLKHSKKPPIGVNQTTTTIRIHNIYIYD